MNRAGTVLNRSHQCLAFTDYVTILARTNAELQRAVTNLEAAAEIVGLEVNTDKTKYMLVNTREMHRTCSGRQQNDGNREGGQFHIQEKALYLEK